MTAFLNYVKASPDSYQAMAKFSQHAHQLDLEPALLELVRVRASQINRCAFCLDMHTLDARAAGETEQRLYSVSVWRETPFYSPRERAALEWTEAVTEIGASHAHDELYERVRAQFTEDEVVSLTMAIIAINGWNRLAISFRQVPGTYQARPALNTQTSKGAH